MIIKINKESTLPRHVFDFISQKLTYPLRAFENGEFPSAAEQAYRNIKDVISWDYMFAHHLQSSLIRETLLYYLNILIIN